MTGLDTTSKAEIRFFTYYLLNGTLDFNLLNKRLKTNHIDFMSRHPHVFFESFCVFANHKRHAQAVEPMNKRIAEYLCKSIEPENFPEFNNFEDWEVDFDFSGDDYINCLKEFAYKVAFDKIESLTTQGKFFKDYIAEGATFWETVFVIWANNLEFENNNKITNQEYAINRAAQWYLSNNSNELWELELEM